MSPLETAIENWKRDLEELRTHQSHMANHGVHGSMWDEDMQRRVQGAINDLTQLISKYDTDPT